MSPEKLTIDTELSSKATNFILKEITEWLDKLEIHSLGKTPNVVVTLDSN